MIKRQNMITPRSSFACVYLDNGVYAIGGITKDNKQIALCERYDLSSNKWQQIAPLNNAVVNCCCTQFMGQWIYKFGGKWFHGGKMGLSDAIEKYDPRKNKWFVVGPVLIEDDLKNTPIWLSNMGCS